MVDVVELKVVFNINGDQDLVPQVDVGSAEFGSVQGYFCGFVVNDGHDDDTILQRVNLRVAIGLVYRITAAAPCGLVMIGSTH